MWCEQVVRNLGDSAAAGAGSRVTDWVDIEWSECGRLLKKHTRAGQPVRVLLPRGTRLRHDDVIYEDATQVVAINVVPCEVIVAQASDPCALASLALELGNLHHPTQIATNQIIFIEDGPAMAALDAMQIQWSREVRRFAPMQIISTPIVEVSPNLRTIIRSKNDSVQE